SIAASICVIVQTNERIDTLSDTREIKQSNRLRHRGCHPRRTNRRGRPPPRDSLARLVAARESRHGGRRLSLATGPWPAARKRQTGNDRQPPAAACGTRDAAAAGGCSQPDGRKSRSRSAPAAARLLQTR